MWIALEGRVWLYRGVPARSEQARTARAYGEVCPPRPGLTGEDVEYEHTVGGYTDSGYTSWSTKRSIAEELGLEATEDADAERGYFDEEDAEEDAQWRGRVVILRVRIADVSDQMERGEEREDEWRLRGRVEGVEVCEGEEDDDE